MVTGMEGMRLALFMPRDTAFYRRLFSEMKRGLRQAGFEVAGGTLWLDEEGMSRFVGEFRPRAVLEMNRSRAQIPWFPKDVIHIGWIVDLWGRPLEAFGESEILYFFERGWAKKVQSWRWGGGFVDWLPPGFCPDSFFHEAILPDVDFSFAGHIPKPWNKEELSRQVCDGVRFADFFDYCRRNTKRYYRFGAKVVKRLCGRDIVIKDQSLWYDMEMRGARIINRVNLLNTVLAVSGSIALYGNENWLEWPEFSKFYQGDMRTGKDLRRAILRSRLPIHEGSETHFRILEIMGSGSCLFFYLNPFRVQQKRDIDILCEPGIHYIPFSQDDLQDKARFFLTHEHERQRIGQAAQALAHKAHTWRHRALKISRDIMRILSG